MGKVFETRGQNWFLHLLFGCFLLSVPIFAAADEDITQCGGSLKPVGMVNSSNGGVYDKGEYGFVLKYIGADYDQSYEGGNSVSTSTPGMTEKSFDQYQATLRAGLFENVDARVLIPLFNNKDIERENGAGVVSSDDSSGLGDIKLLVRYSLMAQKKKDLFNLAIGAGLKAPTGDTDNEDSSGSTPGYLQTGSGSWDPIFEIGGHRVSGRHWVSSYLMYQMTTEGERGDSDYEAPDLLKFSLGYAYALSRYFDLQLEMDTEWRNRAELEGAKQEDTGGTIVYVTPGGHIKLTPKVHFDLGVAVPVYRDLNGTQLSEDYRVIGKLAFRI
jgi:hypothetical protein